MKKTYGLVALLIIALLLIGSFADKAYAQEMKDQRSFHYWYWEDQHATMINTLLISANDQIVQHTQRYVILGQEYSHRDPLLNVYGLKETCSDSEMDAFLMGLKANNLIYLIHTADKNPEAKKMAIKDLRLLAKVIHNPVVIREFPYWADLLEEGRFPSNRLSHIYVHYTVDVGNFIEERGGVTKRFFYWLGYLINDFTVANLCNFREWVGKDQEYLVGLYSIRRMGTLGRFNPLAEWWKVNTSDMVLRKSVDEAQQSLFKIREKYMDRQMGDTKNIK